MDDNYVPYYGDIKFDLPVLISELVINGDVFVRSPNPMPCLWWRLWYWILLGWKWKALGKKEG